MPKSNPSDTSLSEARAAANRANARHSTGPRTPEGKAISSLNALKHGGFSRHLGLAAEPLHEDRAEIEAFAAELAAEYQPDGPEETILVDRMAALWWRLQRLAAQQQVYLAERVKAAIPLAAVAEAEASSLQEARLDRMLRAARKDLLARQAWRLGATARRVAARRREWEAEMDERGLDRDQREWQERMARMRAQQAEPAAAEGEAPETAPRGGNGTQPGLGTEPIPRNGSSA
jgi:hypothetical protein